MVCRLATSPVPPRRGMLLLLVLSVLALFVVAGAIGVLVAIRARESARAFAAATAGQTATAALARSQLDAALLKLVRGPSQSSAVGSDVTESLLEDKYGTSQTGTATAVTSTTALVQVTVTGIDTTNPATIAGRVLTFVPASSDPSGATSHRIVRAERGTSTSGTLWLANGKPTTPLPLPTVVPCEVVLNGREFVAETYDAYDDQNRFLTQPVLQSSTVSSVTRPAFAAAGTPCTVDNDGDGVSDGVWLDGVLRPQPSPNGGQLSFSVSYLVLDLDGRINLNAHGSYVRSQVPLSTGQYPQDPATVPVGLGFGPVDVDASRLVATAAEVSSGTVPARWQLLLQGGTRTQNALVSATNQWRPAPLAEATQFGRYGFGSGTNQPGGTANTGTNPLNSDYWVQYSGTPAASSLPPNSPTDLKARLQVFTEGSPPTLRFARPFPAWVTTGTDTDDVLGSGTSAHPYRLRLDDDAPRGASTAAWDAVFTVGELERILRPFDADAAQLAPRLAALLDDYAERSRMTVTTDSWDTPAITGTAASRASRVTGAANPNAVHSPDVVAGLRFNLNRPVVSGSARQEYFRQLYTLLVALDVPAAQAAQGAANLVEFRDSDSTMTWYPYDPTPLDGTPAPPWTTASTGTGVWGVERPEMVITSASNPPATNQAVVSLYRPWQAVLSTGSSATISGTTERIAANLGNSTTNTLNATLLVSGTPVWRLSAGGTATGLNSLITTATAVGTNAVVGTATLTGTGAPTQAVLERLANPAAALDTNPASATYNDYVPVHRVSIPMTRSGTVVARWLHWPNRDLVSHGELLTVPAGDPATMPEALFLESAETGLARSYPLILDATMVPSRFVGAAVSVGASGSTQLAAFGMADFQHGHFSRWREAGRVNVNTILSNTGNSPASLDDAVWRALVGRSGPVRSDLPQPARSAGDLLVTGGDAVFPLTGTTAAGSYFKRATAIRLANCATTRSHVFAVWITLKITDSSPNAGPPRFARLFAVIDRSIPAGYAPGRTLNVRETIRLQRYLE